MVIWGGGGGGKSEMTAGEKLNEDLGVKFKWGKEKTEKNCIKNGVKALKLHLFGLKARRRTK